MTNRQVSALIQLHPSLPLQAISYFLSHPSHCSISTSTLNKSTDIMNTNFLHHQPLPSPQSTSPSFTAQKKHTHTPPSPLSIPSPTPPPSPYTPYLPPSSSHVPLSSHKVRRGYSSPSALPPAPRAVSTIALREGRRRF